eukprot:9228651-Lingulodinium_polyedra.AAC.1
MMPAGIATAPRPSQARRPVTQTQTLNWQRAVVAAVPWSMIVCLCCGRVLSRAICAITSVRTVRVFAMHGLLIAISRAPCARTLSRTCDGVGFGRRI